MRENLATYVEDFRRHGKQIAAVAYRGNRRRSMSYGDLAMLAGRFSRLLAERGIAPGDRVLLWGANSGEWVGAFFGCVLRGVVVVPLDHAGSAEFAARVIEDTKPRLIVADRDHLRTLPESLPKIELHDLAAKLPTEPLFTPDPSLGPESTLQILYTSGTTAAPKGIVHTHGNVLASVNVLEREMQKYLRYERWVHPLRILHTLPLSHVFGQFMGLWVASLVAAEVHYEDTLVAAHLIERIHRERISVAVVVPRVLVLLRAHLLAGDPRLEQRLMRIQHQRPWWRWWHTRDVHRRFGWKFWAFVSGGATLPEDVEQFWNELAFVLVQGYGMTETTALATLNHPFRTTRGSIGKPLEGREVRVAEDGEILVRGPMVAAGTWRNGGIEARTDEWLHTGDLGTMDASGNVRFVGRKGDVIVAASGMNIHPADLESAVRAQAGVRDAMVVGWDGPSGPEPVAVVITDGGHDESALAEIRAQANRSLQEFQQIHRVLRWPSNEFPRNSAGKPLRREVSAWVAQQLTPESASSSVSSQRPITDPLLRLLAQVTGQPVEDAPDSAELATDLHLDSLGRMQLAMGIEEQMSIAVSDETIAAAKTLGDLREVVNRPAPGAVASATPPGASKIEAPVPHVREANVGPPDERRIKTNAENLQSIHDENAGFPSLDGGPFKPSVGLNGAASKSRDKYPRWPWSAPVQAARVLFVECVMRPLVALLARPRVQCDAALLPREPSIYVCNHVTAVDGPLVLFALRPRVRRHMAIAMSAELLTGWRRAQLAVGAEGSRGPSRWIAPVQAFLITALCNAFPLPAGPGLRRSFAHAGEALDRGFNVLIFPEGRRTRDGLLQPFQSGISVLAQESDTAVVPVALVGLWNATQRKGLLAWLRPKGLSVVLGAPLRRNPDETHPEFAGRLRDAVEHLIQEAE
jgi:long-chain acyl-CoA synthetase